MPVLTRSNLAHTRHRSPPGPAFDPDDPRLRWAPPDTTGWAVATVNSTAGQQLNLTTTTDYIIDMPSARKPGSLILNGGRNLVLIGGEMEVGPAPATEAQRRALYLLNVRGDIFIEGLHLHRNAALQDWDAIYIRDDSGLTGDITIQNCLMEGIQGTFAGWHGDGIQFQGDALYSGTMRLDRVTIRSDYQGMYNSADGPDNVLVMSRTNFVCTGTDGVIFWSGDNLQEVWSRKRTQFLDGCYLNHTAGGGGFMSEVRPNDQCEVVAERPVISAGVMTWPSSSYITGALREGSPPGGDYTTSSVAGYAYTSPGYQ